MLRSSSHNSFFEYTRYRQKNLQALLLCLVDRLFTHIDVIFVANVSIILEFWKQILLFIFLSDNLLYKNLLLRGEFERFLLSTFYFFCNFVALNQWLQLYERIFWLRITQRVRCRCFLRHRLLFTSGNEESRYGFL